ncbi:hypothetical protein KAU08_09750 [bacterium]|nr:hypothetical protein [bacterium]
MTLLLASTRDQALLAKVIKEAKKTADKHKTCVGRTALQKILYFLKVAEVPMSYRFSIHHYGPFCSEILRDLDILQADRVITNESNPPDQYNYAPSSSADELMSLHPSFLKQYKDNIRNVVNALIPLDTRSLELIATIDYVYRWIRATGVKGPWKKRVIRRFQKIKKGKFGGPDVENAYDILVKTGLIKK